MDGLTLLRRARDAGLRLEDADTSLKIIGPRNADSLVRRLAQYKTQVLNALRKVQEVQERYRSNPAPSDSRLSHYDETGLFWPLRGRPVVALMETEAAIQGAMAVLIFRKLHKPALGPVGDSLDDWGAT